MPASVPLFTSRRALVFRQKKRRAHIVNWLHRERRVSLKHAKRDVYGYHRSLWTLSITRSAHKGMSSYWFDKQGLLRLERLWRKYVTVQAPKSLIISIA